MGTKIFAPHGGMRVGKETAFLIFKNKTGIVLRTEGLKYNPCEMIFLIHLDSVNIVWL